MILVYIFPYRWTTESFIFHSTNHTHFRHAAKYQQQQLWNDFSVHVYVTLSLTYFPLFDHFFDRVADGASEDDSHYGMVGFSGILPPSLSIITGLTGIDLARLADLPSDVLVESRRVAERLADLQKSHEESSESRKIANRRKALLRVIPFSVTSSCVYAYLVCLGYCTTFLWTLRLGYDSLFGIWPSLIAPDAINSSVWTFCSTRQGPSGIYRTIPSWYCEGLLARLKLDTDQTALCFLFALTSHGLMSVLILQFQIHW